MREQRSYETLVAEIQDLDRMISARCYTYRQVKKELNQLDREICDLNKLKWSLERELIDVKKLPPVKGPRRPAAKLSHTRGSAVTPAEHDAEQLMAMLDRLDESQREEVKKILSRIQLPEAELDELDEQELL